MPFVVRKIDYIKWTQRRILEGEQPSADAITNCMKTTNNTLSLWSVDDENEIEEAVLAIAAQFSDLDTIDILTIDPSLIKDRGLSIQKCLGMTPYKSFAERHLDVVELDYKSLGLMAEVIIESLRQDRWKRIFLSHLKTIISKGVDEGKIQWSDLKKKVREKIPQKGAVQDGISATIHSPL